MNWQDSWDYAATFGRWCCDPRHETPCLHNADAPCQGCEADRCDPCFRFVGTYEQACAEIGLNAELPQEED